MRESSIEKILKDKVKNKGGLALKFISPGMVGVPDRIVLIPGGRIVFVELKASKKLMRPIQLKRKLQFENLGFLVYCIDSLEGIDNFIGEIFNDF